MAAACNAKAVTACTPASERKYAIINAVLRFDSEYITTHEGDSIDMAGVEFRGLSEGEYERLCELAERNLLWSWIGYDEYQNKLFVRVTVQKTKQVIAANLSSHHIYQDLVVLRESPMGPSSVVLHWPDDQYYDYNVSECEVSRCQSPAVNGSEFCSKHLQQLCSDFQRKRSWLPEGQTAIRLPEGQQAEGMDTK